MCVQFEVGTGDECEDLPGDEKLEDPFLYSWLLKQGPTAMNPYAPKHDKLPKGYMGRAPDSDESSCADYDSSFVDDEEFEGVCIYISDMKTTLISCWFLLNCVYCDR